METAKDRIKRLFESFRGSIAVHEVGGLYNQFFGCFIGYSDNCLASRLNELEREGYLRSRFREGKKFKEWYVWQWTGELF